MNLGFEEILIIIGIALVIIGPQRLPDYAEQLGKLVRNLRQMATGATQTIREELGDEIADIDLTKFDPRQYDPRRIVREALLEDIVPATKPAKPKTPTTRTPAAAPKPRTTSKPAATAAAAAGTAATATAAAATATVVEDAPVEDATGSAVMVEDAPVEETSSADVATAVDLPPFDDEAT